MRGAVRTSLAAAIVASATVTALAQTPSANPACQRLEGQLTALERGNTDPARADQIRQADDAVQRQQFEVDKLVAQARRMGCNNTGFFSIFTPTSPQCGPLNRRIEDQRDALERMQNQLERLQGGTAERAAQRQSILIALADNNCGPQYRAAARAGEQGGFFDRLFGGGSIFSPQPNGPMGGTYRTVCVRTCDGYYFPISFETSPDHFREDEQTCQRMCPAAEVQLYTYHNPGEEMTQAVSLNGRLYTELPAAFQYRKALSPSCSCRRPGESWAEALRFNGGDTTLAPGDVVVTEQNADRISQGQAGLKPAAPAAVKPQPNTGDALADAPGEPDPAKRKVRAVGPTFLPQH
ncbi:MAG TPA: DUF2865 domain-containing protein [Pseudolabrys sp.]|nr:DUF2865 domain-containing protein [Pseudolabrys sp.]